MSAQSSSSSNSRPAPAEVLIELAPHRVKRRRRLDDPRRDPPREAFEHRVHVLLGKRQPHEASPGGRERAASRTATPRSRSSRRPALRRQASSQAPGGARRLRPCPRRARPSRSPLRRLPAAPQRVLDRPGLIHRVRLFMLAPPFSTCQSLVQRAPGRLLRAADRRRDLTVGKVGHVAQHAPPSAGARAARRLPPTGLSSRTRRRWLRRARRPRPGRPPAARAARGRGERRAPCDERSSAPTRAGWSRSQPRVGAQRRDERLLEAVLGVVAADRRDEKPPHGIAMGVEKTLKGWQSVAHTD